MQHRALRMGVLCTIVVLTTTACTDQEVWEAFFGLNVFALLANFMKAVFPGTVPM